MFYFETDNPSAGTRYIGGLREDSLKNIYFFPVSKNLPTIELISFPNDTAEHLIYTFNNLDSGMILPINTNNTTIKVMGVDSILLGSEYRKRYEIYNYSLLFGPDYWIEGIGSSKQLFSAYTYEFEWNYYTLCYTDSVTYFINSPNGEDSCHYQIPLGLNEHKKTITLEVYPNPASESIFVDVENKSGVINVYNISGKAMINNMEVNSELKIDLTAIQPGIYFIEFISDNGKAYKKFIKK